MPELAELEARLTTLGRDLDWPATPDLALTIRARIAESRPVTLKAETPPWAGGATGWSPSRWALAAIAVLVALVALFAYAPTREAIANWVNVHTRFQQVPHLPTPTPLPPGPLGTRLGLGNQTTLGNASSAVKWHLLVPSSLGQPDEVYLQLPTLGPPQGEVTLVYSERPGIPTSGQTGVGVLITEARGAVDANFFGKMLGPDSTIEAVTVGGQQGYWISGAPHGFLLIDANGKVRDETFRLATNTLLIDDGGTIVRIEGNLTKVQALQIAASLS
ncbi:MAG TPA: hypothetical protein VGU71_02375 [Candidatus Dormibacteraeota bacterium]|nr:hypothetical protein [Candidatus Dormibacteraeota bacterium]